MSASTKLSTSVKALCYLAESYPNPKSSVQISMKIGANASKLRQLLSMLAKNGVVKSNKGTSGGFMIIKNPSEIHLQEIYCAIEDRKAFHLDVNKMKGVSGKVYSNFNQYFQGLFSDVQIEIEDKMRMITLRSIMDELGLNTCFEKK